MLRKFALLLSVLLFAGICSSVVLQSCKEEKQVQKNEPDKKRSNSTDLAHAFVGDQNCKGCHDQEYAHWEGSHHASAMAEANDSTVLGDFDNKKFTKNGVTTTLFRKGSAYWVHTQGPEGTYQEYQVVYVFGVTPLQQYLIDFGDGKLQTLSVSWDDQKKIWYDVYGTLDVQHAEWLHWSRGGLNWNSMCADCHSTYIQKNYDFKNDTYSTTFEQINVSCEACHGPGEAHVNWANSDAGTAEDQKKYLLLTTGIDSKTQVDQCARCHSRRSQLTNAFDFKGEFMDSYVPSVLRQDLYHSDGQIDDEVYVYGSFLQSKMYQNDVECTDCHDAHTLQLKALNNALCTQCHVPEKYDNFEHHFHGIETEGALCVNCHMPGKNYMGIDFRRDHSFRVPRPDLSVAYGTPNACIQCHTDQTDQWAASKIEKYFGKERPVHFSDFLVKSNEGTQEAKEGLLRLLKEDTVAAIVKATALHFLNNYSGPEVQKAMVTALNHASPIVRYYAVLSFENEDPQIIAQFILPRLFDTSRSVRLGASRVLAIVEEQNVPAKFKEVLIEQRKQYETSMMVQADFPAGKFLIGQYYEKIGAQDKAIVAYESALEKDNYFNNARINLARLYNLKSLNNEAVQLYKMVVKQEPDYAQGYYALGLLYAEMNALDSAKNQLVIAIDKDPLFERAYYNLGLIYHNQGSIQEAERWYLKGIKVLPSSALLHQILVILYMQNALWDKAEPHVDVLLRLSPENTEFQQMKSTIQLRKSN